MAAADTPAVLKGRYVLVVEDQYLVADEMRRAVLQLGGQVLGPAPAIEAARALMRQRKPDLALLDVNLRGEFVDPLAVELRSQQVPIMFTTGYSRLSLAPSLQDMPHLEKPVTPSNPASAIVRYYPEMTRT